MEWGKQIKLIVETDLVSKHAAKVRSGMARKRAEGARFGRPRKELTDKELAHARKLRAEGLGWRRVAREINRARGALELTDPKRRRTASVTHTLMRRKLGVSQSHIRRAPLHDPWPELLKEVQEAMTDIAASLEAT